MKHEATSAGALLLLALGGAVGCTAYPTYKSWSRSTATPRPPTTCKSSMPSRRWVRAPSGCPPTPPMPAWSPSPAPFTYVASAVEPISDGPRCGSTAALVIRSERNNDWGSLFGINIGSPARCIGVRWAVVLGARSRQHHQCLHDPVQRPEHRAVPSGRGRRQVQGLRRRRRDGAAGAGWDGHGHSRHGHRRAGARSVRQRLQRRQAW